jgi:hypothetical protein
LTLAVATPIDGSLALTAVIGVIACVAGAATRVEVGSFSTGGAAGPSTSASATKASFAFA